MSIIKLPLHFEGSQGEKTLYCLFDSGATFSCISAEAVAGLEILLKLRKPLEVATAAEGHYLRINHSTRLDFYYDDIRLSDEFMVIPGLSEEVILGVNTFQKWRIKLDFEHDKVIIEPEVAKAILKKAA
ncbi:MAG: retroviral-like aspartic protease [Bacteroidia bacterium]|nr:retroviral-like aspartic protease [Bacteroidia bacterium]